MLLNNDDLQSPIDCGFLMEIASSSSHSNFEMQGLLGAYVVT